MPFIKLAASADLPAINQAKEIACNGKTLCVANVEGVLHAMDNVCLHRGGPLGQGMIENGKVVCPWHGWAWDPTTGQAANSPGVKVAVYPVQVEGGAVMIDLG